MIWVPWVDRIPAPPAGRRRGRPAFDTDRLLLKARVIMIGKHGHPPDEWRTVWAQATPARRALRPWLTEHGRYPTRCTWERRLAPLPDKLPAQVRCLGTHLVGLMQPRAARRRCR